MVNRSLTQLKFNGTQDLKKGYLEKVHASKCNGALLVHQSEDDGKHHPSLLVDIHIYYG